ncbi:MAG: glycoside hydrolase [Gemmatimonadota bacterium]|nr:glycoside hydrolase [Gemmatimonadota bacterium]
MSLRNVLGAVVAIVALTACDANRPGVTDPGVKATASGQRALMATSGTNQPRLSGVVTATQRVSAFGSMSVPADVTAVQRVGVGPNRRVHGLSWWPRNETTISVDGTDSRRLVAGANDYSSVPETGDSSCGNYASTDGGTTWHDVGTGYQPVALPAAGDPATAFDANGTAYFVCLAFNRETNSSGIFVARSRDLRTITPMTPVITTDFSTRLFNDKEFVAIDSRDESRYRGRIYVTWTQFDYNGPRGRYRASPILISYSSNGGATWSAPHAVTSPDLDSNQGSVPAVGPNGELLVVFENFNTPTYVNQVMVARSLDGGRTFERPVKVDELFDVCPKIAYGDCSLNNSDFRVNSFPSIAVSDNGTAHVVWNDYRNGKSEIRYSSSSNGGRRWGASSLVSPNATSGDQVFPWVATDEDGKAHVVYYDRRDDPNNYLLNTYVSSQRGRGFGAALRVSEVSSDPYDGGFGGSFIGDYNGIAAGGGQAHPIWTDTRRHAQDAMTATVEFGTGPNIDRRQGF